MDDFCDVTVWYDSRGYRPDKPIVVGVHNGEYNTAALTVAEARETIAELEAAIRSAESAAKEV